MFSAASSGSWFMPTHHAIFAHGGLPARVGPSVVGFHSPKQPRVQHPNLGPQGCANQCYTHCQLRVNSPGRAPARQIGQHPNICYAAHPPPPHHIHQAHNNRAMPQQQCAADCIEQVHTLLNAKYSVQQQQYSTNPPPIHLITGSPRRLRLPCMSAHPQVPPPHHPRVAATTRSGVACTTLWLLLLHKLYCRSPLPSRDTPDGGCVSSHD